jgi:predicted nucleic acid-binding protein
MKTSTLIDSNVLIDVLGNEDLPWRPWSLAALKHSRSTGRLIFSAVVWAELCGPSILESVLTRSFEWLNAQHEDFPFAAAYAAGCAYRSYRRRGGIRDRTLPDFLIGAHALANGHKLLTRDAIRYRSYFPDLEIISPDTHP